MTESERLRIKRDEVLKQEAELVEKVHTRTLCDELKKREGVTTYVIDPYEEKEVFVSGPAVVFVVID